ncbi:THO complex subunit 1 transcription elongation factor-domain-containing protein [Kockovaella imperatae]|uniref:THO complex subunit 1 transcription elongation factor-domain-containing protein n=1 Tax=Kockovaella imperatae TaxID=4999 RepID=A0A1Y1UJF7_9TREE|nr:THO complex subunit 1 transcription elongation factor-domain-containing protein [Kockovaella imperatae]ORX37677.1 THO complex subunit 1 transcription elongation factor-domain-containing protein [Kockovaella imperatae]
MAIEVLSSLQVDLQSLVASTSTARESQLSELSASTPFLPPIPRDVLKSQLEPIWNKLAVSEVLREGEAEGSQTPGRRGDLLRNVMDIVGREIIISPLVQGEVMDPAINSEPKERARFLNALSDRLDTVLTLYELCYAAFPDIPSLEPGAIFIPLLEELVELISVESWRDLWQYVETRSKRFTNDMPASKGKALPLLRTINAFLRFLPRTPADLVFRGRVHQFASSVISIADKSAINMRGDYGDVKTTWEEVESVKEEVKADTGQGPADGDVDMEAAAAVVKEGADVESKAEPDPSNTNPEPDFYSTLWSLQQYFASPPLLAGPSAPAKDGESSKTPFDDFKDKSDFVLPKLFEQTVKEKELMGIEKLGTTIKSDSVISQEAGRKRKREHAKEQQDESQSKKGRFFHPRYLTGRKLLEHELADNAFRRQILVQYFILFQFLLNLTPASASKQAFTGGMPKDFVIDAEKETWVKSKIASIREELRRMPGDGVRFEEVVLSIIARERHYAQWKNENCPEKIFEVPPMSTETAVEAAQAWKKRLEPPQRYPFPVGSRSLSRLWNKGFTNLDQLKGWKR